MKSNLSKFFRRLIFVGGTAIVASHAFGGTINWPPGTGSAQYGDGDGDDGDPTEQVDGGGDIAEE